MSYTPQTKAICANESTDFGCNCISPPSRFAPSDIIVKKLVSAKYTDTVVDYFVCKKCEERISKKKCSCVIESMPRIRDATGRVRADWWVRNPKASRQQCLHCERETIPYKIFGDLKYEVQLHLYLENVNTIPRPVPNNQPSPTAEATRRERERELEADEASKDFFKNRVQLAGNALGISSMSQFEREVIVSALDGRRVLAAVDSYSVKANCYQAAYVAAQYSDHTFRVMAVVISTNQQWMKEQAASINNKFPIQARAEEYETARSERVYKKIINILFIHPKEIISLSDVPENRELGSNSKNILMAIQDKINMVIIDESEAITTKFPNVTSLIRDLSQRTNLMIHVLAFCKSGLSSSETKIILEAFAIPSSNHFVNESVSK